MNLKRTTERHQVLGVLTPRWGAPSETFVRRHLTSISPARTVAATRKVLNPDWCPGIPLKEVGRIRQTLFSWFAHVSGLWRHDRRARAIRAFFMEHQVTAVLGEWLNFSSHCFPALRNLGIRFYAHAHGYDITRHHLRRPWTRFLYRQLARMDGVITVGQLMKDRLLESIPLDPDRIHVIPCAVDVPPAPPERPGSDTITCLHVGRMVAKKGPLISLRAFHAAHRECPKLRLEFVGGGPLLDECRQFAATLGLSNVVKFHGSRPPDFVRERLRRADIFLLHSIVAENGDEEGLPVAILEAMAQGLPVISTRHAAIPEAVLDGETGLLVPEGDTPAMTLSILRLARHPGLAKDLGEAAHRRAADHFSADAEVRRLRELLFT